MYKKGILLTLSFVTLGTILFSVAFLISYHENEAEQGVTELITLDNLYLQHMSLSNTIKEIFSETNSASITFNNNYIELMINNENITDFREELEKFKGFIQLIDNSTEFSSELSSEIDLKFEPYNISYSHPYSSDTVTINLNDALGLNITMDIDDENVTGSWTWSTSTTGDFSIRAYIEGEDGNGLTTSNIDLFDYNYLEIETSMGSVSIEINNSIATISKGATKGTIKTQILLNNYTSIVIPNAYTITSYNSQLTGSVQLTQN